MKITKGNAPAAQRRRELTLQPRVSFEETAGGVAVYAVPLAPPVPVGKLTDEVAVHGAVPRFREELTPTKGVVLGDGPDHGRRRHDGAAVGIAAQARRQVEPEAVDVVLLDPVP